MKFSHLKLPANLTLYQTFRVKQRFGDLLFFHCVTANLIALNYHFGSHFFVHRVEWVLYYQEHRRRYSKSTKVDFLTTTSVGSSVVVVFNNIIVVVKS